MVMVAVVVMVVAGVLLTIMISDGSISESMKLSQVNNLLVEVCSSEGS